MQQYSQQEFHKLILPYRQKILKATILTSFCTFCIIIQRFFKEPIMNWEVTVLHNIQSAIGITDNLVAAPFYILANIQEQYIFLILVMHLLSWVFYRIDKQMAIKSMLIIYVAWYILILLELIYHSPQPVWITDQIITFMCDQKYGSPGDVTYLTCFTIYSIVYQLQIKRRTHIIIAFGIFCYCFLVYLTGQGFFFDMFLGLIYFFLIFALIIKYDNKLTNFIKSKETKQIFSLQLLFFSGLLFIIAVIYYALQDHHEDIEWIQNYFKCYSKQFSFADYHHYKFNNILGAEPTFCQITILVCISVIGFIDLPKRRLSTKQFIILQLAFLPGWIALFLQSYITSIDVLHRLGLSQLIVEGFLFGFLHWWIFSYVGRKLSNVTQIENYQLLEN